MLAEQLYEFRNDLRQQGIVFCYSGYITESVLTGIGEALKQKLVLESADKTTMRNIFAIFVEQMQNVIRYSAEREPEDDANAETELRYGIINIGFDDHRFFVSCGNKILSRDVERLSARLGEIRDMDADELKSLYKQKLRSPTEATSKGAGVGFIEIARRSSDTIVFDFMDIDNEHSFFALKAYS